MGASSGSPRLLVTRRWPEPVERYLADRYEVTLSPDDVPLSRDALAAALRHYDVILPTITDRFDAAMLGQADVRTRLLCNYGAGTDHVDLAATAAAGIAVSNTPDVLTDATAELALALMLAVARRLGEGERELRAGGWAGWRPTHLLGTLLSGATLGIVGFGRIGRQVARIAHRGLAMPVLYHARTRASVADEAETNARFRPRLDDLLAEADIVSLHVPAGPGNDGLIGAAQLARMKPTAILINTARGSLVDERALADALTSRTISGAGLDVYAREPSVPQALLALDNVVLAPHLGSATRQTRERMGMRAVENLELFLADRPLRDPVFAAS